MRILFLDIDGVLNSRKYIQEREDRNRDIDPKKVEHLNGLIKRSKCFVVISSCWKFHMDDLRTAMKEAGSIFEPLEYTPFSPGERGGEIQSWMDRYNVKAEDIVILDDDIDMKHLLWRLVCIDNETGLQEEHVDAAMTMWGIFEKTI